MTERSIVLRQSHWNVLSARRLAVLALFAALIPSAWIVLLNRDMSYLGLHDDGIYWTSSRALAEGRGYRILHLPGEPYQTKFPPLYAAFLSLCPNLAVAAIISWLWLPAFAALSYFALEELVLDRGPRLLVSVAIVVNPACIWAGTRLVAELMFASLVMATAIACRYSKGNSSFACASGALAGCACLTKTAGLPLLIAVPAVLFVRTKSARVALLSLSFMVPVVAGWHWWAAAHRDSRPAYQYYVDYVGWFRAEFGISDLPRIVAVNMTHLLTGVGSLAVLTLASGIDILCAVIGLVACFGIVRLAHRNGLGLLMAFAAGYAPLLLVWNFVPGERFILPLLPLITVGAYDVLGKVYRCALPTAAAVIAIALLWASSDLSRTARSIHARVRDAATWITVNTPQDARILTSYDVQIYLSTGRSAYRPALPVAFQYYETSSRLSAIAAVPELCRRERIDYLLRLPSDDWFRESDPRERDAVNSMLQRSFEPVLRSSDATLYRLARNMPGID